MVAQIYGVGLITTRLTGVPFELGIFLGLGGILVCSFLGGMRAVTWTQVAQYIILIIAYMIPVIWLSVKQTGIPIPQIVYGKQLEKVTALEEKFLKDPKELEVRGIFKARADEASANLKGLPGSFDAGKAKLVADIEKLKADNAPPEQVSAAEKAAAAYPKDAAAAKAQWTKDAGLAARAAPPLRHAEAFPGKDDAARDVSRRNFLALVFCLMVGTAALPHILMRYYTTPSVRQARESVFWSLFFIFLLYFTAPALGVLAKFDVYSLVVGLGVREAAAVGGRMGGGGSNAVVDRRRQQGRHRAARRDLDRRRHHRARHTRNRGLAVRGLGPRRRGRAGRCALHRGRPAADHRQRAVARLLLQDARSERVHGSPRDDLEDPAARGGVDRGDGGGAEAGGHPVPRLGGLLARGGCVLPGAGAAEYSGSAPTSGARRSA